MRSALPVIAVVLALVGLVGAAVAFGGTDGCTHVSTGTAVTTGRNGARVAPVTVVTHHC
ncbi:hypothetical protein [Wenjunlia tyrosinilytica]|uniref:Uncharacterized protein n=1 Tax=Wenjunlia tyrosinilytica TaxID=1544741 RepID=A0A917ZVX0_9ACTN|nr:hypothetical protein [Wenjunlia tyrosinilytica]GGO98180.1 hypothetical protein GCM10012280_61710 [Wenjunlia tyrosinilytica]